MTADPRTKFLIPEPKESGDPATSRIQAMLKMAKADPEMMKGQSQAARAAEIVRLHTFAIAAEHGIEGYSSYKDAVPEEEVMDALRSLPSDALRGLSAELAYVSSYSHFEAVRLLASFCTEE
jgi:hypothetical protein